MSRYQIWINGDTLHALKLVAETKPRPRDEYGNQVGTLTADELANQMLKDAIKEQYPQLSELQKQIAKMEKEIVKQLGGEAT